MGKCINNYKHDTVVFNSFSKQMIVQSIHRTMYKFLQIKYSSLHFYRNTCSLGDPSQPRPVAISLQEYVKHVLMLSLHRFDWHKEFALTFFDIISKKNALQAMGLYSHDRLETLGNLSTDELKVQTLTYVFIRIWACSSYDSSLDTH